MKLKIEELQNLVDVTITELNEVHGGHAARILARTFDPGRASLASGIVLGKSARDFSVILAQQAIGVPNDLIEKARVDAIREGRGRYTAAVTFAKLEG